MASGMGDHMSQLERSTGVKPGKGRGLAIGTGRGVFLTPPSNLKSSEPLSAAPVMGVQSQGVMPATLDEVGKTMGRVNGPGDVAHESSSDLQRALEAEIVDHLRNQNAMLMDEIEKLKTATEKFA